MLSQSRLRRWTSLLRSRLKQVRRLPQRSNNSSNKTGTITCHLTMKVKNISNRDKRQLTSMMKKKRVSMRMARTRKMMLLAIIVLSMRMLLSKCFKRTMTMRLWSSSKLIRLEQRKRKVSPKVKKGTNSMRETKKVMDSISRTAEADTVAVEVITEASAVAAITAVDTTTEVTEVAIAEDTMIRKVNSSSITVNSKLPLMTPMLLSSLAKKASRVAKPTTLETTIAEVEVARTVEATAVDASMKAAKARLTPSTGTMPTVPDVVAITTKVDPRALTMTLRKLSKADSTTSREMTKVEITSLTEEVAAAVVARTVATGAAVAVSMTATIAVAVATVAEESVAVVAVAPRALPTPKVTTL